MNSDRRARKLAVIRALSRPSLVDMDKENNPPQLTVLPAPPFQLSQNCAHSTPVKFCPVTDLDASDHGSVIIEHIDVGPPPEEEVVITINDTTFTRSKEIRRRSKSSLSLKEDRSVQEKRSREYEDSFEISAISHGQENDQYDSKKFLNEALGEEYKSLDESLPCVSATNLLEEIEADLPVPYSLAHSLEHTLHTVSGYRTVTRLARMSMSLSESFLTRGDASSQLNDSKKKMERLEREATVQKVLTEQADKAIQCSKRRKSMGTELIESEKAFLLASLRYEMTTNELRKLRVKSCNGEEDNVGQLTISDIIFNLDPASGDDLGYFVCVVIEKETVLASRVLNEITDKKLFVKEKFNFKNLEDDFVILIQLYRLYAKESKKYILKKNVLKKLRKVPFLSPTKNLMITNGNQNFNCLGCAELRLHDVTNTTHGTSMILFNNRPQHPLAGETLTLFATTSVEIKSTHSGFLNVFKNSFWHRRWFSQSGYHLNSWSYPDDEDIGKPPIERISLPNCAAEVHTVGIDVCIRPHSFAMIVTSETILFAADSHKEMWDWIKSLNLSIRHFNKWKPDV